MAVPTVVYFHQFVPRPRPEHDFFRYSPTPEEFRTFVRKLKEHYRPLGMEEFYRGWQDGRRWPPRSVLLTFDDGFRNNLYAARILREEGLSGVFFVLSEPLQRDFVPWYLRFAHIRSARRRHCCTLDGQTYDLRIDPQRRRWLYRFKERILSVPPAEADGMLARLAEELDAAPIDPDDEDYVFFRPEDLREMVALGMDIGAHSATHMNLAQATDQELHYEIVECREKLVGILGQPVTLISYPDGRFDERVIRLTSQHYRFAFAASPHWPPDSPWRFPRRLGDTDLAMLSPWYPLKRRGIGFVKRCLGWGSSPFGY